MLNKLLIWSNYLTEKIGIDIYNFFGTLIKYATFSQNDIWPPRSKELNVDSLYHIYVVPIFAARGEH